MVAIEVMGNIGDDGNNWLMLDSHVDPIRIAIGHDVKLGSLFCGCLYSDAIAICTKYESDLLTRHKCTLREPSQLDNAIEKAVFTGLELPPSVPAEECHSIAKLSAVLPSTTI